VLAVSLYRAYKQHGLIMANPQPCTATSLSYFHFSYSFFSVLLAAVLLLGACDMPTDLDRANTQDDQQLESSFQNVTSSFGWQGLSFLLESGSAISSTEQLSITAQNDEHAQFQIFPDSDDQIDLVFSLDAIERGDPFTIEVIGQTKKGKPVVLSEITHRPSSSQGYVDLSHVGPHGQLDSITCRTGNTEPQPIDAIASLSNEPTLLGTLDDWPSSFHYISRGDAVLIEWDYERSMENTMPQTASFALNSQITTSGKSQTQECSHIGAQLSGVSSSTTLHSINMVVEEGLTIAAP
jgi:hypothetical protein